MRKVSKKMVEIIQKNSKDLMFEGKRIMFINQNSGEYFTNVDNKTMNRFKKKFVKDTIFTKIAKAFKKD